MMLYLRPVKRRVYTKKLKESLRKHVETLKKIPGRKEPRPGELAQMYFEEEFE